MGAYENPPMAQFNTSTAGQAWANAAASFGKSIGDAITLKARKEEARIEKENKLGQQLIKDQAAWAAKGVEKQEELRNSEYFKSLDQKFQEVTIANFKSYWDSYSKLNMSTSEEDIAKYTKEVSQKQSFKGKAKDQIFGFNEFVQNATVSVGEFADKDSIATQGTIDCVDHVNNNIMIAGQIMNGMNGYTGSYDVKIDSKENYFMEFNYEIDGDKGSFIINAEDLEAWKSRRIPETDKMLQSELEKQKIIVDGKLSSDYYIGNEFDVFTEVSKDPRTGEWHEKTFERKRVDEQKLENAINLTVQNLPLTDNQKVSAFQNIFKTLAPEGEFKFEDLKYADIGGTPTINQEKYSAAAGYYSGIMFDNKLNEINSSGTKQTNFSKVGADNNKYTIYEAATKNFDKGEPFILEGGKSRTEVSTTEKKGNGWFKDGKKWYRVLTRTNVSGTATDMPVTYIANRSQALAFLGAKPELK